MTRSSRAEVVRVSDASHLQVDSYVRIRGTLFLIVGIRGDQLAVRRVSRSWHAVLWLETKARMLGRVIRSRIGRGSPAAGPD